MFGLFLLNFCIKIMNVDTSHLYVHSSIINAGIAVVRVLFDSGRFMEFR